MNVAAYVEALQHAGQPMKRNGRVWTWDVKGGGWIRAVLTPEGDIGLVAVSKGKRVREVAAKGVDRKRYLKLALG